MGNVLVIIVLDAIFGFSPSMYTFQESSSHANLSVRLLSTAPLQRNVVFRFLQPFLLVSKYTMCQIFGEPSLIINENQLFMRLSEFKQFRCISEQAKKHRLKLPSVTPFFMLYLYLEMVR